MQIIKKIYICLNIWLSIQYYLNGFMQTTRQRILDYLEINRTATSIDLSRAFRMTSANLRHHLAILQEDGLISSVGQQPANGRGRPTLIYMITKQSSDHSLGELASALFEQVLGKRASKQRSQRLKRLAENMQGNTGKPDGSITQRLVAAIEQLNLLRYRSHWEAHTAGPRVILGQCPYASIIDKHPELCNMDAHMIAGMLGELVTQTAKIERKPNGIAACVFEIEKNQPAFKSS